MYICVVVGTNVFGYTHMRVLSVLCSRKQDEMCVQLSIMCASSVYYIIRVCIYAYVYIYIYIYNVCVYLFIFCLS